MATREIAALSEIELPALPLQEYRTRASRRAQRQARRGQTPADESRLSAVALFQAMRTSEEEACSSVCSATGARSPSREPSSVHG
jgi:hypothetical protein